MLLSLLFGFTAYSCEKFFVDPVLRIRSLRKDMHEALLQYGNVWGLDPNDQNYSLERMHNARETYRSLAAKGIAESENLGLRAYFLARWYIGSTGIDLEKAAPKFWAMEADVCDPDKEFRDGIINEIREYLKLPGG